MSSHCTKSLLESFKDLEDPRIEYLCDHRLLDIVALSICAVLSGANHWTEVEAYGKAKEDFLRTFLALPNGIPSHDTIGNLFARLDPDQFRECFITWVQGLGDLVGGQVIAFDGKTVRRSHDKALGVKAIHMVSAWATANRLVLGQIKVDSKSNEITAIPALLDLLDLSGCTVTIDAMGCQKEIAQKILDQGADYIFAVKGNQGTLRTKVEEIFNDAVECNFKHTKYDKCAQTEKGHGRIETRRCWVIDDQDYLLYIQGVKEGEGWPGLRSIIKVEATRRVKGKISRETRYYISSRAESARAMNTAIRSHWGVENKLHWVLDVGFREDENRVRQGHSAEIFVVLRHIALNLLKQEQTFRAGIHAKRLRAGWDDDYLRKVMKG